MLFSPQLANEAKGTVAVEFAFLAPILMFMTFGIINYAEMTNYRVDLDRALRAAANVAVISPPMNGDISAIETAFDYAAPTQTGDSRQLTVATFCECPNGTSIACTTGCADGDRQVLVSLDILEDYVLMVPMPMFGDSWSLATSLVVRVS